MPDSRSPHALRVGDDLLRADQIFLNVGGRAMVPDMPGLDRCRYLTNTSILDLDFLPRHLVIVGGSYIGLEFAQMYRRFGSEVTVIEKGPQLTAREDEDVSAPIKESWRPRGSTCSSMPTHASSRAQDMRGCRLTPRAGAERVVGSHVLLAVGRRPNTDDLGLERRACRPTRTATSWSTTNCEPTSPSIWAMGDCNGKGAFTHTSYNDFEIVAANLLDDDPRRVSDRITTYALYIDPPLGRAGMTSSEVAQSGRKALVGKRPMTRVAGPWKRVRRKAS